MSYIDLPRLVFSGRFLADVSTVNNDVRHYDNATFEDRFQLPSTRSSQNGWWNPDGTGAFRLYDLKITQAIAKFGADSGNDPVVGMYITAQEKRTAAKLVDLDPQMQVVSTIFGLRVVLTDGTHVYMSGNYQAAAFRDYQNGSPGMPSAAFTSILTDVEWTEHAEKSPTLLSLKVNAEANDNKLSINLVTRLITSPLNPGLLIGSIGVYNQGEPESFISGRRLVNHGNASSDILIGDMYSQVSGSVLSLDFSNSIGLDSKLDAVNIGKLFPVILRATDTVSGLGSNSAAVDPGIVNGSILKAGQIKILKELNYQAEGWLELTSGIADVLLDEEALKLISDHPIAIVQQMAADSYKVVLRESYGGLYARADKFVFRMDPPTQGHIQDKVRFRITQWGEPVENVKIVVKLQGTEVTNSYWGIAPKEPNPPKAKFYDINVPENAISFSNVVSSGKNGWAESQINVGDPGNPRHYIDGQIYTAEYYLAVGNASPQTWLDLIVVHARQAHSYSHNPDWESEIAPFMQQYNNLYPIMGKHLFSLADPAVLREHATLLVLAFSRDINDPNHMPATRDLSTSKRQAILNWLSQHTGKAAPILAQSPPAAPAEITMADTSNLPQPHRPSVAHLRQMMAALGTDNEGKNPVMRSYFETEIERAKKAELS